MKPNFKPQQTVLVKDPLLRMKRAARAKVLRRICLTRKYGWIYEIELRKPLRWAGMRVIELSVHEACLRSV